MPTNTDLLFRKLLEFQNRRKVVVDDYDRRAAELETAKGSQYYTDELQKAEDAKSAALDALKTELGPVFDRTLQAMSETNAKRGIESPTTEQLAIVQALKMRDTISESELSQIANSVKENVLCLSIVQEVARKNGILRNYKSLCTAKGMPPEYVSETITGLTKAIGDFMQHDTPRAARIARRYHEDHYGTVEGTLPKRHLFTNKDSCYAQLIGLSGDELSTFCRAVDG